jgi:hypothetical protein
VRLALKVFMQNYGDFLNVILPESYTMECCVRVVSYTASYGRLGLASPLEVRLS